MIESTVTCINLESPEGSRRLSLAPCFVLSTAIGKFLVQ